MAEQNVYCTKSNNYSEKRLFDSIYSGEDIITIQALLREGIDIDARNSKGYTPLLLACYLDRIEIVELLIMCGANVNAKCYKNRFTVLHHATMCGWLQIVQSVLKKSPYLDARDLDGDTAMHHASRSGLVEVVKCLLQEGADIEAENTMGVTPLLCAAEFFYSDIVDLLLNSGANVNGYEWFLLYYASQNGWTELVHSLVKRAPGMNKCLDAFGMTPLHFGKTPLHVASNVGNLEIVRCLVENGIVDINERSNKGSTALHNASSQGHLEIVKWLVGKGAEINTRDDDGRTALHNASSQGHLEIVKWLVGKGADINVKTWQGMTPVLLAAYCDFKDVVDLLMHYGALVGVPNKFKLTLLHCASRSGWMDIVQSIVKQNCNLDARNIDGISALGHACINKKIDIAQYLLQAGASWDILDDNSNSPFNYVTKVEEPEFKFIKLFIDNGAYFKCVDYEAIVKSSSLRVLQDVTLCYQAIVNKFNNYDLPELYKSLASQSLPCIEAMKIAEGSEVAQAIQRTVVLEIQTKGHCNILEVCPMVLGIFSVRSVLQHFQ